MRFWPPFVGLWPFQGNVIVPGAGFAIGSPEWFSAALQTSRKPSDKFFMTENKLRAMLKEQLRVDVEICEVRHDETQDPSPRDRLLSIFGRRFSQLLNADGHTLEQRELMPELKRFITNLEALPSDVKLYFWKARSEGLKWGGWCTDETVIYAIPRMTT